MKGESSSWLNVTCGFFQPPIWLQSEDGKIQKLLTAYHHAIIRHTHRQICCNLNKHRAGNAMRSVKEYKEFFWKFVSWLRLFDTIRTLQLDQQWDRGNILCQNWEPPGRNRGLGRSDTVIITVSDLPKPPCKLYSFPKWLMATLIELI